MAMLTLQKIVGILIPTFFTLFFMREVIVREDWSFKIPALIIAMATAAVLLQNIATMKSDAEKKDAEQASFSKTMGLIVFALMLIIFPQLLWIESHWLFKISISLTIVYAVLNLVLYCKKTSGGCWNEK